MKLNDKEFKRFKELKQKVKAKKASAEEKQELAELEAKKANKSESTEFKPGNDFTWWNKIPELVRDSASFKCNWVPGTEVAPGAIDEVGVGVMAIQLDPVLGNSVTVTDPINVWARDLYLRMFQKYRPVSGYHAADLGIALVAAYEVVKLIACYERIYGIVNRYSKLNSNMPVVEAIALGLSLTDLDYLQGHLSDFRYDLNFLIRKAQRLCIPKDMSIIADAISLFGYEYMDHESVRSQLILFKPSEYGEYSDTRMNSGGSILYNTISNWFAFGNDNMCALLESALNALLGSDSIQRIFADLVTWFGNEAMLQFVPLPEDYVVVPAKSESILHKVHNLETFEYGTYRLCSFIDGSLNAADQGVVAGQHLVYQADDRIVTTLTAIDVPGGATASPQAVTVRGIAGYYTLSSAASPVSLIKGHVIDTAHNDIEPEIIVEGSMWKASTTPVTISGMNGSVLDSTTFYLVRAMTLHYNGGNTAACGNVSGSAATARDTAGTLACIDWAPLSFYVDGTLTVKNIYGEYDNIVFVSNTDLTRIQRTIVLSGMETNAVVINK